MEEGGLREGWLLLAVAVVTGMEPDDPEREAWREIAPRLATKLDAGTSRRRPAARRMGHMDAALTGVEPDGRARRRKRASDPRAIP